jgi:hypothetical protein
MKHSAPRPPMPGQPLWRRPIPAIVAVVGAFTLVLSGLGGLDGAVNARATTVDPACALPATVQIRPAVAAATTPVRTYVIYSRFDRTLRNWRVTGATLRRLAANPPRNTVALSPRASKVTLTYLPATAIPRTIAGASYTAMSSIKASRGTRISLQILEIRSGRVVRQSHSSTTSSGRQVALATRMVASGDGSRLSVRVAASRVSRTMYVSAARVLQEAPARRKPSPSPTPTTSTSPTPTTSSSPSTGPSPTPTSGSASPSPSTCSSPTPTTSASPVSTQTSPVPVPSSSTSSPVPTPVDPAQLAYWGTPVFRDEFNGTTVDSTKWNVRSRTDLGLLNDAAVPDAGQVSESGGVLHVRADWLDAPVVTTTGPSSPNATNRWHKTGYLDTRVLKSGNVSFAQQYGRWEVRAKVPTGPNSLGALPAFWLRNSNSGELDLMESWGYSSLPNGLGQYPGSSTTTVFNNTSDAAAGKKFWRIQEILGSGGTNTLPADPVYNGFHTWTLEFTPTYFKAYYDGRLYASETPATYPPLWNPSYFGSPLHMRINLHVGPSVKYWGLPDPNHKDWTQNLDYQVDYVRVWPMPS